MIRTVADLRDAAELARAITGTNAGALLEDAAFDVDFTKGKGLFRVHVGQFKPPYGAQEMTSSGNQKFVDRALVSNSFFRGRETGVALWGATTNNKFEWRVGMFNGNGLTRTFNDNDKFQYNARADVAAERQPGAEPARVGHRRALLGERLRVDDRRRSMRWRSTGRTRTTSTPRPATIRSGTPTASTASTSSRASRRTACTRWRTATPETGAKFDAQGGFIQAGQLFSRRRFEVAVALRRVRSHRPDRAATTSRRPAARSATTTRVTA